MPVVPYRSDCLLYGNAIYTFLTDCYQLAIQDNQPKIASLSFDLPLLDPLTVLAQVSDSEERHFYLENPGQRRATVAFGTTLAHTSEGKNRFRQAQQFVETWTRQTVLQKFQTTAPPSPRFFCNFTFFPQHHSAEPPFPAASVFLPSWQVTRHHQTCQLTANLLITPDALLDELTQRVLRQIDQLEQLANSSSSYGYRNAAAPGPILQTGTVAFKQAVSHALTQIAQNRLSKIVLAHAVDIAAPHAFHLSHSLHRLRQNHPDCHTFSVSNGRGATFIGASPERLLSTRHHTLITDALAGSAPRGRTEVEDRVLAENLLANPKERDEHQFVVEFLTHQLLSLGLRPSYRAVPELLRLANIQHLHTPIRAMLPTHASPLRLVEALHPTPAVAGVPTEAACQEIWHHEAFDRSLYAAPLGWVDDRGNSEFIVGIRSALIQENRARLYAGAGIVVGSDPERELAEIQLKLRALGEALG
ncbi:isochorismate synthase [Pseudanabaena sp. FACHB-2040]|uniref:isochorismate synthase n=1 Tax=Pseudanabaena sp. FACHB-2040 TaxID=2692859 RepID=UPI001684E5A3|nr:isochorismate synthase [Pseudanabaena sp. FACHB-2040]MBD2256176.1 isochorismate synthase [Pseudanabaena sp. FACHB-2040]